MPKSDNLPTPGVPARPDKPGEPPTAAARIDAAELHRKNIIAQAKLGVGDKVNDPRTGKNYEVVGIGVRAGVAVYLVRDEAGEEVLRNQDEFDEAQGKK